MGQLTHFYVYCMVWGTWRLMRFLGKNISKWFTFVDFKLRFVLRFYENLNREMNIDRMI